MGGEVSNTDRAPDGRTLTISISIGVGAVTLCRINDIISKQSRKLRDRYALK